jgi:tetratricopeptide (TPR) repeat protein
MKRTAVILAVMSIVLCAAAQNSGQPAQQTPPAAGQAAPAQGAAPLAKRPPQAKTQPEFEAWKAADATSHPTPEEQAAAQKSPADAQRLFETIAARTEKAADDFATKFPDSEVRVLLYKGAMRNYQAANNGEKAEAMGRKVLSFDGDDPEALVIVAEVIAERTRDTDLDKDQRYDEATKMAQKATATVDSDITVPPGTPQDKLDAYKSLLRSNAYSIVGTIAYKKENYPVAQENLQKSIDAFPSQPDPVVVLRLALSLDKQQKYPEALKLANRAIEVAQAQNNATVVTVAQRERDRLQQLTGGAPPAQPASQPPKN